MKGRRVRELLTLWKRLGQTGSFRAVLSRSQQYKCQVLQERNLISVAVSSCAEIVRGVHCARTPVLKEIRNMRAGLDFCLWVYFVTNKTALQVLPLLSWRHGGVLPRAVLLVALCRRRGSFCHFNCLNIIVVHEASLLQTACAVLGSRHKLGCAGWLSVDHNRDLFSAAFGYEKSVWNNFEVTSYVE
jgi:hypothetical protein